MNVKRAEERARMARRLAESCCDGNMKKKLEKRAQKAEVGIGQARKCYQKRLRGDQRRERPQGLKQL